MLHVRALDHAVLNVADVERSLAFYVGVLGLQPERVDAYRSGTVRFPSVRVTDATIIDLFGPPMHGANAGGGANLNHLCFALDDTLEGIRAALRERAIPVEREATRNFGARGDADSLYVRDPDGNVVELRTYGR